MLSGGTDFMTLIHLLDSEPEERREDVHIAGHCKVHLEEHPSSPSLPLIQQAICRYLGCIRCCGRQTACTDKASQADAGANCMHCHIPSHHVCLGHSRQLLLIRMYSSSLQQRGWQRRHLCFGLSALFQREMSTDHVAAAICKAAVLHADQHVGDGLLLLIWDSKDGRRMGLRCAEWPGMDASDFRHK